MEKQLFSRVFFRVLYLRKEQVVVRFFHQKGPPFVPSLSSANAYGSRNFFARARAFRGRSVCRCRSCPHRSKPRYSVGGRIRDGFA